MCFLVTSELKEIVTTYSLLTVENNYDSDGGIFFFIEVLHVETSCVNKPIIEDSVSTSCRFTCIKLFPNII